MKTYTLSEIRDQLATDQRWLERALVVLFEHQTYDEKVEEHTKHHNGVGFNSSDSRRLTYYAKWVNSGKHLSGRHLETAFRVVPKYARQIEEAILAKQGA